VHERYVDAALEKQDFDVDVYPGAEDAHNRSTPAERERLKAELKSANATHATHVCRSRCLTGAFRSKDGMCKRCTPAGFVLEQQLEQLLSQMQNKYFAVFPCSPGKDTYAKSCEPRSGTKILGHDPAETGDCPRECIPGWRVNTTFNENGVAYNRMARGCRLRQRPETASTRLSSLSTPARSRASRPTSCSARGCGG
jgi:hypothetical protein